MGIEPSLLFGKVMHKRLFPKVNAFVYNIYYLALPLSQMQKMPLAYNRPALLSFYDQDHGPCDGGDLQQWARGILTDFKIDSADGEIVLICMPRVLGYVFNPVSFWLCYDHNRTLRAVLCEVHNTFGERHTYVCAHTDHRPISSDDILKGEKVFHVSPMLKREGHYTFRFDVKDNSFNVWINFQDADAKQQLVTSLNGEFAPMKKSTLQKVFWKYPLITFKAIFLIHWQALKLLAKGIKYNRRPRQKPEQVSTTENLTKI